MPVQNNLRQQVDLPIWEWLRFLPTPTTQGSCSTTHDMGTDRFIYYMGATTFNKYDTISDSWQTLTPPPSLINTVGDMKYAENNGYYFRVISCTAPNQLQMAALFSRVLTGYTVRVLTGNGMGQTNVVASVSDPIVADFGIVTSAQNALPTVWIQDTNKNWAVNQWRDYQVRITVAGGAKQIRKILYNNSNTLVLADINVASYEPQWAIAPFQQTPVANITEYQIESHLVTFTNAWITLPDSSSRCVALTGGVWFITNTSAQAFTLQYYDVIADTWYYKQSWSTASPIIAPISGDIAFDRVGEYTTYYTGIMTSVNVTGFQDSVLATGITPNRFAKYRIRVISGSGIGYERGIVSHDSAGNVAIRKPWFIGTLSSGYFPTSGSAYTIYGDFDHFYLEGNGSPAIYQYTARYDNWSMGYQFDYGLINNLAAIPLSSGSGQSMLDPEYCFALTSIVKTGTNTGFCYTVVPHCLKSGDKVSVYGATGVDSIYYNGTMLTGVIPWTTNSFTYVLTGTPVGTGVTSAQMTPGLFQDATVSYWNTLPESGRIFYYMMNTGTQWANVRACLITGVSGTFSLSGNAIAAPLLGTKYMVCSGEPFGKNPGSCGMVNANSTASLINDPNRSWFPNSLTNSRLKIIAGTGFGQEVPITANVVTGLTIGTLPIAPIINDGMYAVYKSSVRGSGIFSEWMGNHPDTGINGRYLISNVGGGSDRLLRYDIPTETYEYLDIHPFSEFLSTGTMGTMDNSGRMFISEGGTSKIFCADLNTNRMYPSSTTPYAQPIVSLALAGGRMSIVSTVDGLKYMYMMRHGSNEFWRTLIYY